MAYNYRGRVDDPTMGVPTIGSYAAAEAHYTTVKPWPDGWSPAGKRQTRNRAMFRQPDGSITFRFFDDEVITYHPDGTISVMACQQQRNADFFTRVCPKGITDGIATRSGPVLSLALDSVEGGAFAARYEKIDRPDGSVGYAKRKDDKVLIVRSPNHRPVHMALREEDGGRRWFPIDVNALTPFRWISEDKAKARRIGDEAGFSDLIATAASMKTLGVAYPEYQRPDLSGVVLYEHLLGLLKVRDVNGALSQIERSISWSWKNNARNMVDNGPRRGMLDALKTYLLVKEEAFTRHEERVTTVAGLGRIEGQIKRFERALQLNDVKLA